MHAIISFVAILILSTALTVPSYGEEEQTEKQQQAQEQKQVYGWQLMTDQEQKEYRERIQKAQSDQKREQIRAEHHVAMQARAKAQGVTLPDEPRQKGQGGRKSSDSGSRTKGDGTKRGQQRGKP